MNADDEITKQVRIKTIEKDIERLTLSRAVINGEIEELTLKGT